MLCTTHRIAISVSHIVDAGLWQYEYRGWIFDQLVVIIITTTDPYQQQQ